MSKNKSHCNISNFNLDVLKVWLFVSRKERIKMFKAELLHSTMFSGEGTQNFMSACNSHKLLWPSAASWCSEQPESEDVFGNREEPHESCWADPPSADPVMPHKPQPLYKETKKHSLGKETQRGVRTTWSVSTHWSQLVNYNIMLVLYFLTS